MNVLKELAIYISKLCYDDLPKEAVEATKRAFIDTMGVSLAGSKEDVAKLITDFVKSNGSKTQATIIGRGLMASCVDAALANGTILHALDFDDTGAYSQGHPSAPVFPVIVSLAEEYRLSGKQIIEAYVVGVEILSRLARAMPMLHLKGWHPTSVLGTIASAATAAKLLNLNKEEIMIALSLAGTQASGIIKSFGSMAKPFHVGRATSNGITAAFLAQAGFSASNSFLNGDMNFANTFFGSQKHYIDQIPESIGKPLAIISPGINIKQYPSCSLSHRVIDGILEIVAEHSFSFEEILQIECNVPPRTRQVLQFDQPITGLQAKFSMPFALACGVLYKEVRIKHFTTEVANSEKIKNIIEKVIFKVHFDWKDGDDARPDIISVKLKNGVEHIKVVSLPKGNAQLPLSPEELLEKYLTCVDGVLLSDAAHKAFSIMENLEMYENIDGLMQIVN